MLGEALYQEIILDHYKNPHGAGLREPEAGQSSTESHQVNPTCGDEITLRVHIVDNKVVDVSYDAAGCSISQAAASVMHEQLVGTSVEEAQAVHEAFTALVSGRSEGEPDEELLGDGIAFEGVAKYPARVKCALLPWMAFRDAAAKVLPPS